MKKTDFYFELPPDRIAQFPPETRGESRLMLLDRSAEKIAHYRMNDLPQLIESGALVVFNDSRVRKARIFGTDEKTGKQREFLLLSPHPVGDTGGKCWKVLTRGAKKVPAAPLGTTCFADGNTAVIWEDEGGGLLLSFSDPIDDQWLEKHGHIPLPPYIKRADIEDDSARYQTVYARETGSAAAPTAGLHFSGELLGALKEKGVETAFITLHVGLGTFLPVRTEDIEDHKMHTESFFIDEEAAVQIERAKAEGRKIIAVGTTTARALESAWKDGSLMRGRGETAIFIRGSYQFKVIDALFTNFHTPESTLLMLVAAFCAQNIDAERGRKLILGAYKIAIECGYRFFSYGDAMLVV
ncbi:MAG: tRNA preQ1(34) S-adenosylmethionine ribosyltransferase-isomerase QueA [Spirochaetaceae bacterium]|jgi:S-adenosylmethionine:tRNA ribosyltransferase-isomerase|nr:tRNA preQ1(34) S-adenosylmethionine ribosyltransferase-isomerase QueA [Spirochaetaceae bacterium]